MTNAYWDGVWRSINASSVVADEPADPTYWLTPYLDLLRAQGAQTILEVGCGSGQDTRFLTHHGFTVTATDFSAEALAIARGAADAATFLEHDTREPFPFPDQSFDLVLASLSLHYFPASETRAIVEELARLLRPRGLLLFRLNSTKDANAATGSREFPRYYYTEAICRELFTGWELHGLTERVEDYLGRPKALWEGLARKR